MTSHRQPRPSTSSQPRPSSSRDGVGPRPVPIGDEVHPTTIEPSRKGTDWQAVKRMLEARGLWNDDGIGRAARARMCNKCGRAMLVGLDHDRSAAVAKCDPTPLNRLGEANALLQGRATYSLRWIGNRYELDYRMAEHISGSPAGTDPRIEIVAGHLCDTHTSDEQRGPYIDDPRSRTTGADDDQPPY